MGFTEFLPNLTPMVDLARIVGGFGLATILLVILKHNTQRRYWRTFKRLVDEWASRLSRLEPPRAPANEDEWVAVCERMLSDAKFGPLEAHQLIGTAVLVAKAIVAEKFFVP